MDSQKSPKGKRSKAQLIFALIVVVVGAIALTSGLTWLFAFNQLGYLYFWERQGDISGEEWQNHIRSAATLVGVPGVAAALVFSYFKQRTNDRTQETTAAVLALQQEQHDSEIVSRLRGRYTTAAEQLGHASPAVQLAGIYALAGLADDWGALGRIRDRQDCIDMLISTLETTQEEQVPLSDNSLTHIETRICRIFQQHFGKLPVEGRSWSDVDANLSTYSRRWGVAYRWEFDGGSKIFTANTISTGISTVMQETTVRGTAQVSINVNEEPRGSIILHAVDLKDQAVIDIDWEKASESKKVSVLIQRSNLLGGELRFHERVAPAHKRILHFEKCKFTGTRIKLPQRPERYEMIFDSCTFDVNPFYQHLPPDERPKVEIQGTTGFHGTLAIYAASEDSLLDDQWLRN